LPLALLAGEVITVDPSGAMLAVLRESMSEYGIRNVRTVPGRWPLPDAPQADVALMAHVGYDVEDIGPFLDGMEAAARRLCVAMLFDGAPTSSVDRYWQAIHGEHRVPLPALREFLALQLARGRLCEVRLTTGGSLGPENPNPDRILSRLRQQLLIEPGGEKDRRLQQVLAEQSVSPNGGQSPTFASRTLGIVTWKPVR
jgi:hypothetical protein